jgi:hypothetical protein
MLVDKLGLPVTPQEHAEIVEPGNDTLKFHPVDQEDRYRNLCLADVIEKSILQILFVGSHDYRRLLFSTRAYTPLGAAPGAWGEYAKDFPSFQPKVTDLV